MADKKISELTSASLPLAGTEVVPIVQGGETKKVAVSEFGGSTPNLQQVTDVGNTTNKGIELNTEDGLSLDFSEGATKQANLNATSLAFSFYSYISTFFVNFYYNGLTANRDYLLPDESGTIATREWTNANKQDTLVSATNIKTINGNSVLGSGDLDTKIQNYFTFSTNTTLTDVHHNAVIWVTATCNITIASGLRSDFNCTFRTFMGVTATFLTSGTTINAESDGDVQAEKTMSYLAQYTTNNYILSGGGLS